MDFNKFTVKSQEAIQAAQTKAVRYGHLEVDGEHLLLVLMEQADGLVPRLLQKMGVPLDGLRSRIEQELERKPRVSGPGAEAGKVYVTQRLNQLLVKAEDEARRLKDEYVSVEHILLGFIEEGGATRCRQDPAASLVSTATCFCRPSSRCAATSGLPVRHRKTTYEALQKYGRDLVEEARSNKLDPVIGRDAEIRRVIRILCRKTKNNPVLIGEPGVGKTAIVEGLAHRIVRGDVPEGLKDKTIFALDMGVSGGGGQVSRRIRGAAQGGAAGNQASQKADPALHR